MQHDLPDSVIGWITNHATKNYWRVASFYDIDDLIQDGLVCGLKCREAYGYAIEPKHFMALVKSAFYNHIGDLLRKNVGGDRTISNIADCYVSDGKALSEDDILDRLTPPSDGDAELAVLIAELPEKLKKVVEYLFSEDGPKKLLQKLRPRLGGDEIECERLRRLTGFPVNEDFETEFRVAIWEREVDLVNGISMERRKRLYREIMNRWWEDFAHQQPELRKAGVVSWQIIIKQWWEDYQGQTQELHKRIA